MFNEGIFAVYKPKGITSNDAVQIVKRQAGGKKTGHAGTLDPLAEGVLVVGVGREATKQLSEIVKKEKEYLAVVKFGETSSTDDAEGEKIEIKVKNIPEIIDIEKAIKKFQGNIMQIPPVFSAIKVNGRKAYKLARAGREVEMKPREIEIKKIDITDYKWPVLKLKVVTGPGAYIRALARDIGDELGVGGYLADLERTRVGQFIAEEAARLKI
ncbi:tRNA pseudouridine(55) synthase TruB [Patescibacteria group bacterium]|nr:tRNA pseudouridine(55) synthase TruB [Candidatus Falkowbacteria bacterium]MBU3906459.1 tRNA pseudouridine(55) synthase TruB [Patescibacteria group bacterium]MBU4014731.1 tRNA pseudouridine(55) synthase TruB [Patescibacteria group bacterium]MBU4027095.1 tRNA pseudouridine(55) synthase TruB [Patescibacteria group bacterium]MBU4073638.1 tRNA pseudouridine(55) synthase TruB [Patescibacteria group bacterium]